MFLDDIMHFTFLAPGFLALVLSVICSLVVSRDIEKVKILIYPMYLSAIFVGFEHSFPMLVASSLLFVYGTFGDGILTQYIEKVRGIVPLRR